MLHCRNSKNPMSSCFRNFWLPGSNCRLWSWRSLINKRWWMVPILILLLDLFQRIACTDETCVVCNFFPLFFVLVLPEFTLNIIELRNFLSLRVRLPSSCSCWESHCPRHKTKFCFSLDTERFEMSYELLLISSAGTEKRVLWTENCCEVTWPVWVALMNATEPLWIILL